MNWVINGAGYCSGFIWIQAIILTNDDILSNDQIPKKFIENVIAKWRPFYPSLNVLKVLSFTLQDFLLLVPS